MLSLSHILRWCVPGILLAALPATAHAALAIAYGSTVDVSCHAGVCTATAQDAVLGIKRLEGLLANGDVTIVAGSQANDIAVEAPFSWVSGHGLTLDSRHAIRVDRTIDVAGPGALTLTTNDGLQGGTLSFGAKGNVHFWSTANSLTVDGASYTLVDTIASLAGAVASAPSGRYALAGGYDATPDGTYASAPVATKFTGVFEGLGNTISNLRIDSSAGAATLTGLFGWIYFGGAVENLVLKNINVHGGNRIAIGGLAGTNFGRIENVSVRGIVTGGRIVSIGVLSGSNGNGSSIINSSSAGTVRGSYFSNIGGLAGFDSGGDLNTIANSRSTANVIAGNQSYAGGLVGILSGLATKSWASGSVRIRDQKNGAPVASAGGLIGYFNSFAGGQTSVSNCYASGSVSAGTGAAAGGLIGIYYLASGGQAPVTASYAFGAVSAGGFAGGLIGFWHDNSATLNTYWDLNSSGISDPSKAAGNRANEPGVTGLTTAQLQSGLPAGFSAGTWAQNPHYLNGRPFLISNLPN